MLVLFESASGYYIFKVHSLASPTVHILYLPHFFKQVNDEGKLNKPESLFKEFQSAKKATKLLSLEQLQKFKDASDALASTTSLIEGKISKRLKKFLTNKIVPLYADETLAVSDAKLASAIKEKFNISCVTNSAVQELMTCIRSQLSNLVTDFSEEEEAAMQLGLSHG